MGRGDLGSSFLCEGGGWVGGTITVSTSRTLRTSKLNGFINTANSLRSNSEAKYYEPIFTKRF